MPITRLLPVLLLLFCSGALCGQDILGSWSWTVTTPEGETVSHAVNITGDGTLSVDLGNDGSQDIHATYTFTDGKISMRDVSPESECYGQTGVYQLAVSGNTMTATLVNDPCDARRSDRMVMRRQ